MLIISFTTSQLKQFWNLEVKLGYWRKETNNVLEAAQMKFLRHLLGITKLDKEKSHCIRQKNWSTEHSKGNKTVPGKVATTCTEDGHKQTTKTSTTISTKRTKEHRTTEEEMEGPTSSWGSRNRLTCLTLQEHDDDDDSKASSTSQYTALNTAMVHTAKTAPSGFHS